jgi:putative transposase
MRWLQSTFSNRFNRFRKENGHVFQGRYKAILLEGDAVGPVCHYIHLNPVRAGLVAAERLEAYGDSGFHQLWYPRKRWSFQECGSGLEAAGGLADTPKGRSLYRDYLGWLAEEEPERKRLGFEKMSRGWAIGTKAFKKAVSEDLEDEELRKVVEAEAWEIREPRWERSLAHGLAQLGRDESQLREGRKGEVWKVALARWLRETHQVPNGWIANRLSMGTRDGVSSLISRHRKLPREKFHAKLQRA